MSITRAWWVGKKVGVTPPNRISTWIVLVDFVGSIELHWSQKGCDMSAQDVVKAWFLDADSGGHDVGFRKLSGVGTQCLLCKVRMQTLLTWHRVRSCLKEVCKGWTLAAQFTLATQVQSDNVIFYCPCIREIFKSFKQMLSRRKGICWSGSYV